MHNVPSGVVKYFITLLISDVTKGKIFYIGHKLKSIDARLLKIHLPNIIGRFPRSISDIGIWKATEFKNWLLHFSVPVLHGILPAVYLLHWSLLVGSLQILCGDKISVHEIASAREMLIDFVRLAVPLYGLQKCTMNVHLLTHLAVCQRGPLWS